MKLKGIIRLSCLAGLLAGAAFANAQSGGYTGPSSKTPAAGYTGPSNVPLMSAKNLLASGKDDQYVRLRGKLLSHKGDEDYEFADESGKITVEIDARHFPAGVTVDQNTLVELTGEFDKDLIGESTLDVKQLKVVSR
jgi:uncharacterized protein (TIGR00156 family)